MPAPENEIPQMDINKRILQFIETEGLKLSELADILDVPRSRLSHIKSGRNKPNIEFITKMLLKFPNLNPEWLLLGTGRMYKVPPHNIEIKKEEDNIQNTQNNISASPHGQNQQTPLFSQSTQSQTSQQDSLEDHTEPTSTDNINTQPNKTEVHLHSSQQPEPERILILFPDHTFVTYKERK